MTMQCTRVPAEGHAHFKLTGPSELAELKRLLAKIGQDSGALALRKLLLDLLDVEGDLSMGERYELGVATAEALAGFGKIAVVQLGRVHRGFAALVANNRGARINIFTEVAPALAWLQA